MPRKTILAQSTPSVKSAPDCRFRSLSEDQLERLQNASFEILERTGVRFHHPEAVALLKKAGAKVLDDSLVRFPPELINKSLKSSPENITVYNQEGDPALEVGGYRSYYGTGSDCIYIYDLETGTRRKAVLQDVVNGVRLVESLPHLDFVMSMYLPSDVPEDQYERHQMAIMLRESTKPIIFVGLNAASTVYAIKMASIAAGALENLRERPFIINYINPVSSFQHDYDSVQRLLFAAERNIPTIYAPGKLRGITEPMTPAGAMALGFAGQLAGLVVSQLKQAGSPFIISNPSHGTIDMRSMVGLYASPEDGPYGWDLAHYNRIPTFAIAGASDSKTFDAQAAAEAALSLYSVTIGGSNLIHDLGYLDCAMTGSLELVTFCNEVIGWLKNYLRDLEINEETLALDLIHQVGPDGDFLDSDHTLKYVKDDWMPSLFDRFDYTQWTEDGQKTFINRANKTVRETLDSVQPKTLPDEIERKLQAVIDET
ncbi:MAG: trimethylamine methyltransferase family protein [Chloroflexi bacterium]|nr:trimethylamine methyltransferase family protein [Chloroflexota bacterium]